MRCRRSRAEIPADAEISASAAQSSGALSRDSFQQSQVDHQFLRLTDLDPGKIGMHRVQQVVGLGGNHRAHPDDVGDVLNFYRKRIWIEEQNRDIKTGFKGRVMRFLRAIRFERMWSLLGLVLSIAYSTAQKELHQHERLSQRYKDGRKDLSWLSLSRYIQ
jgi:hypothetical protein